MTRRSPSRALWLAAPLAACLLPQCSKEPKASSTPADAAPRVASPAVAIPRAPGSNAATASGDGSGRILGERIRVVISGSMQGRLEPCGCASGQLGGLPRRATYLKEIHGADLLLEGGGLVGGATPLDQEKAFTAVEVLFGMQMRYDALGLDARDLPFSSESWGQYLAAYNVPVVASDLESAEPGLSLLPYVEKEVRGTKVRVLSLTTRIPLTEAGDPRSGFRLLGPTDGYRRGLEGASPDALTVLMVHSDAATVKKLAAELTPRPDLVVGVCDEVHEPPARPLMVGPTPVVFPGIRGRFLIDLQLGRAGNGSAIPGYEPVPLRASETKPLAGQDPAVREAIRKHRLFVAEEKLRESMADKTPLGDGLSYVGSGRCGACHVQDHELWSNSKHGKAWDTLVRAEQDPSRYGWPVTQYPDCVSCHVVGYGEKSGFVNPTTTPDLANVGCERCHGPGSAHSADPKGKPMGKVGSGTPSVICTQCHDFEQSPDFDYSKRWAIIEHGKGKAKAR